MYLCVCLCYVNTVMDVNFKFIFICFVAVLSTGNNLALGRPARQLSTQSGASADRAVDGNTDGHFSRRTCTHTYRVDNPWWAVDLGSACTIGTVKIYNRVGKCSNKTYDSIYVRLRHAKLRIPLSDVMHDKFLSDS